MCLGECTPFICHSCMCIPTDVRMWQRYTNSVHVYSSFVRNLLWRLLIYRLPEEHWRMANKHDQTCSFTSAAKSCTRSLVFGQSHLISINAASGEGYFASKQSDRSCFCQGMHGLKPFFPGHARTEAVLPSESFDYISTDSNHYYCYFVDPVSISIPKLLLHGTTSSFSVKSGLKLVTLVPSISQHFKIFTFFIFQI